MKKSAKHFKGYILLVFILSLNYYSSPVLGATYDATGTWSYTLVNQWNDCGDPNYTVTGLTAITQNGSTFMFTDMTGIYAGRVDGATYTSTIAYPEDGGITIEVITFTLDTPTSGSGWTEWWWSDGWYECEGWDTISIEKQPIGVTYDATGTWNFTAENQWNNCDEANSTDTGTIAITQDENAFRFVGYKGTQAGIVSGSYYTCLVSYPEEGGTTTISIIFDLESDNYGSGDMDWYWTDGWDECWGFGTIDISKIQVENTPPKPATLSFPPSGSINVSLTPILQTGSFSDPDSGATHRQTEWQISAENDFSSNALVTISASSLTSLTVPKFVLAEGTTCYWRVRFYDNHLRASDWSDVYSFTTLVTTNDQNSNGIPDDQENHVVDLDGDGTQDFDQINIIKSLNTVVGNGQMGASRRDDQDNIISIESIESIDPNTISEIARPYSMPLGLLTVGVTVKNPADSAELTVYFSEAAPVGAKWYMHDSVDGWVDYSEQARLSADRKSVRLKLKDWGYGDADGIANGTIVDPGGFGLASWIEGLVYDSSTNQGIARAQVTIHDLGLRTALDGHYLSMILPGTYGLEVSASGYDPVTLHNVVVPQGGTFTKDVALSPSAAIPGDMVTSDLWIRAVINTVEKGPIDAVWQKGGEDTTSRGDRVIWGHFYASPNDVTWGSQNNPDLFVKIWFDVNGRVDVNFFHVSVPDIEVYSDYPYDGSPDEHGTTTTSRRYIRQYYQNGESHMDENYEDGSPPSGYSPGGNPSGYLTINDLRIGSMINTVEKGPIDAVWRLGGQDTTSRGDQVVWGHYYASPLDVTWGSQDNPDLFVKIWFDVNGRIDVNFFHVSVPDIEVYSDLPNDGTYDQKGTTIMDNRYIRHEYWR